jgi:hypothetical protein
VPKRSDDPIYNRKHLSNYEGYKRLDKSLEKLAARDAARAKLCEVCGNRTRAWRIVPASAGTRIGVTRASLLSGGLRGKFIVACDNGPGGCAAMLERSGVVRDAIEEEEAMRRMGLVLP